MARILITDDNPSLRDVLCDTLLLMEYEVVTANDGSEALKLIDCHAPDLLVLDLFMPDMDGLEVLMALRRRKSSLKVIIMSGNPTPILDTLLSAALEVGALYQLTKPFTVDAFLATVAQALQE